MQIQFPSARSQPSRARRTGVALVTLLITLTSLLVLLAVFQRQSLQVSKASVASIDDRRAFYLAETALSEAMTAVRAGSGGAIGSAAAPAYFGGGVLWVDATDLGADRTRLRATAMCGSGRSAMEAVVVITKKEPLFRAVLNSKERLTLNANVVVDSFASADGTYASQVVNAGNGHAYANPDGDVLSNAGIVFNAGATVFGDAVPGPGYSCSFATGSYVSGATTPAPTPFAFPPIEVPSAPAAGSLTLADNSAVTLAPGTHGFRDLSIGKGATLTVRGPATIVCNGFTGGKNGRFRIDASGGPVTVYVQGTYRHLSGFEAVPALNSPMALAFMISAAQDISFAAGTRLNGAYYAPAANITFTSSNEIWGAFAANRIDMSSATHFHYDESLRDYWDDPSSDGDPLDVLVWRRVGVTPSSLLRDRRDPFTVLDVDREALRAPAQAWIDV